jgi:hypothetical protein
MADGKTIKHLATFDPDSQHPMNVIIKNSTADGPTTKQDGAIIFCRGPNTVDGSKDKRGGVIVFSAPLAVRCTISGVEINFLSAIR